jgi:hypothetical protein
MISQQDKTRQGKARQGKARQASQGRNAGSTRGEAHDAGVATAHTSYVL